MRSVPLKLWGWSALSALLQLLPFPLAGPVPEWRRLFAWVCIVPLLYALTDKEVRPKQAAWLGYVCGVLWYLGNCYWIYPTMHTYGALASPVAAVILLLFAMYLGLYHALFGWLVGVMHKNYPTGITMALVPFVWVAVELGRARITGFPWDLLGNTQIDTQVLLSLAPITGVMGISFVLAAVNALFLAGIRGEGSRVRVWLPGMALGIVLAVALAGHHAMNDNVSPSAEATLVQDNLGVGAEQSSGESREQLAASLTGWSKSPMVPLKKAEETYWLHAQTSGELILWPEAPADFQDGDPFFRVQLGALAKEQHATVIADSVAVVPPKVQGPPLLYNSASFFASDGSYQGRYDKMHLVPFGEYTPFKHLLFFAGHLLDNVGGFTAGSQHTLFSTNGHRYGVFICYESIFGDEIRELARSGADVLVNLSDDGWYGDSSAPWEHLDMVRMRAVENHRWILRATNTGVTASIDPQGRIVAELPRHVRGAMLAGFAYEQGTTFYTRHGDWVAWLCALVAAATCAFGFTRRGEVH